MHQQLCLRLSRGHHLSRKINIERMHSTSRKIAHHYHSIWYSYDYNHSKLIIIVNWLFCDFPETFCCRDWNETCSETIESHISFKWKSLDIISFQGKVGPFRILSEKTKQKAKWKQKSKPTTMLLTNFRQMFLFNTPWKRQKPSCFFDVSLG